MTFKCTHECTHYKVILLAQITKFLNEEAVQKDLGVNRTWEACRMFEELLVCLC